jgi:hypothetical protein
LLRRCKNLTSVQITSLDPIKKEDNINYKSFSELVKIVVASRMQSQRFACGWLKPFGYFEKEFRYLF